MGVPCSLTVLRGRACLVSLPFSFIVHEREGTKASLFTLHYRLMIDVCEHVASIAKITHNTRINVQRKIYVSSNKSSKNILHAYCSLHPCPVLARWIIQKLSIYFWISHKGAPMHTVGFSIQRRTCIKYIQLKSSLTYPYTCNTQSCLPCVHYTPNEYHYVVTYTLLVLR